MKKYSLPIIDKCVETVVLANGEFPTHPIPLSILNNSKYLVCCDGATNNLSRTSKEPDAIVGDCDSISSENNKRFSKIIHRISEQDTNDLTKAVHFCFGQQRYKITILGATGKREDHTIGNISLLCDYIKQNNSEIEMITDYGVFIGIDKTSSFESFKGQQVSLFCIDKCHVTTHDLVYEVKKHVFTNLWQATLNESEGDEFTIETDGRMIVYRAFQSIH